MYAVYILENKTLQKFYIGCTIDISARIKEHATKRKRKYTGRQSGVWQLVYQKEFVSKSEALRFEKAIKRRKSKAYIEKLIQIANISGSSISLAFPIFHASLSS